jgi:predicted HAD superfamily hydrolase
MVNGHSGQAGPNVTLRVAKELINVRELAQIQFQRILESIVLEKRYKPLNAQKAVVQVLVLLEHTFEERKTEKNLKELILSST